MIMYEYRYALGENCCWALLGLKGLRDCSKFWVKITGLKNAIRDTLRHEAMVFFIYQEKQTNRNTLFRIKIKHFPRRTGKRKYPFIPGRGGDSSSQADIKLSMILTLNYGNSGGGN